MGQEKIVVIDTDKGMANLTVQQVIAMVVEEVKVSHDPEEGYQAIRSGYYTGAIIDWKLKGESNGLALLSRIRRIPKFSFYPIIISTGFSKNEDLRIIADYPCTVVMDKPLKAKNIAENFAKLKSVSQWYTVNDKNIKDAFSSPSLTPETALKLTDLLLSKNPTSIPLAMLVAKYLTKNNFDTLGLELCNKHLAPNPKNVAILNTKSKILAKIGDMRGAMECISIAQSISPQNLERLCLLGEIEISLNHPEAAIANFQKALAVDSQDAKSKIGLVMADGLKNGSVSGSTDGASIAKMLNNLGAQLASSGQYQKAIKYYMLSFAFVGTQELQTRVSFNMGLGFKKWEKLPQAKFWLQKSLALSYGAFTKAIKHLEGLDHLVAKAGLDVDQNAAKEVFRPLAPQEPKKSPKVEKLAAASPPPKAAAKDPDDSDIFEEENISNSKASSPESAASNSHVLPNFEEVVEKLDAIASFDLDLGIE